MNPFVEAERLLEELNRAEKLLVEKGREIERLLEERNRYHRLALHEAAASERLAEQLSEALTKYGAQHD